MLAIQVPYPQLFDTDGDPLDAGYVYIGAPNQNPVTAPVAIYWDEAGTQPAAQPLRTLGGYVVRIGTPARVFVDADDYSMLVQDKRTAQVFYEPSVEAVSTLRQDLADTSSPTGGAGMVGFNATAAYDADSIGAHDRGRISVKDYPFSAVGDGTAIDTAAIQAAVDYLSGIGGGTLHFPRGTYKFRGVVPKSNVWYSGEAGTKFIPHIDGANPVFFGFFVSDNTVTRSNVQFMGIEFDFQGDLYPADPILTGTPLERGINCRNVADWTFLRCRFYNNPGHQSIWLSDNSNPPKVKNVKVLGCTFERYGRAVAGNVSQNDHSCLYIQGIGTIVQGNTFTNDIEDTVGTCAELHGWGIVVCGNTMRNSNVGVIVSAIYSDLHTVSVAHNAMDSCRVGVSIWQGQSFIPYDIQINNNTIANYTHFGVATFQGNGSSTFGQLGGATYGESWSIRDNLIRYKSSAGADAVNFIGAGVRLNYCKNVSILNNDMPRVCGRGVLLYPLAGAESFIFVEDNMLYLNEASLGAAYKNAIQIGDGSSTLNYLTVKNNFISDSFTTGIFADKTANTHIEDNDIYAVSSAIQCDNREATLYVKHTGDCKGVSYTNYNGIALGSYIHDTSTNVRWVRKKSTSPFTMNREIWADTLPPGAALYGDIWWSTDVASGGSPGAYCTVGGGSPTWKAMSAVAA